MTDLKFLISKLSPFCRDAAERAANLAVIEGHNEVGLEHLFIQLFEDPRGDLRRIVELLKLDAPGIASKLKSFIPASGGPNERRTPQLSDRLVQLLEAAWARSTEFEIPQIRSATLLVALTETGLAGDLIQRGCTEFLKLNAHVVRENLAALFDPNEGPVPSTSGTPHANRDGALQQFTIDLTAAARAGGLDPVLGREAEIRQMIDILLRRRQNNPILTGEPGVGKTAIVEGFALRVASNEVPPALQGVEVRTLDMGLLLAGASMRGELEDRLKRLMVEAQSSAKPVILFVDEAHALVGDRGEAANLLKPALARGELRMIAATTYTEYRRYFEKDPALARRFQMIVVNEPGEETAIQMLRGLVPQLERHHQVRIVGEAVQAAVRLSRRYVAGRQLPDKAVNILDTACARVAGAQNGPPAAVDECQNQIAILEGEIRELERERAAGNNGYENLDSLYESLGVAEMKLANLEDRCREERQFVKQAIALRQRIESSGEESELEGLRVELKTVLETLAALQGEEPLVPVFVDSRVVAEVVSEVTGIPLRRMLASELHTTLNLRAQLDKRVVGQEHATEIIAQRILSARAGLANPAQPYGVFLLAGPSGVGKTETAMALADLLYGGEENAVILNMSEYQEAYSISGLKGAPAGYVGYGEGGVLTEAVRRRPYCLVLLDEMEKAHSDVLELFYQVFDKGVLEDAQGRSVDFRNTLILMTSNAAADTIDDLCAGGRKPPAAELQRAIAPELRRIFKPALLGRMLVVPYYPVDAAMLRQVIELKLGEVAERLAVSHGVRLCYSTALVEKIASRCLDSQSGARAIDHVLTGSLIPDLSERVLYAEATRTKIEAITVSLDPAGSFSYAVTSA